MQQWTDWPIPCPSHGVWDLMEETSVIPTVKYTLTNCDKCCERNVSDAGRACTTWILRTSFSRAIFLSTTQFKHRTQGGKGEDYGYSQTLYAHTPFTGGVHSFPYTNIIIPVLQMWGIGSYQQLSIWPKVILSQWPRVWTHSNPFSI